MNKDWNFVRCLDFIRHDENLQLVEILCKVCGTAIGGMTDKVVDRGQDKNGQVVVTRQRFFQRFHNYAELKIEFTNGSAHTTNGCSGCLSETLKPEQLQEMYYADILKSPESYTPHDRKRVAKRVAAMMRGTGGLV